jgi:hypothetical protein
VGFLLLAGVLAVAAGREEVGGDEGDGAGPAGGCVAGEGGGAGGADGDGEGGAVGVGAGVQGGGAAQAGQGVPGDEEGP